MTETRRTEELTADEWRLVHDYRALTPRRKELLLGTASDGAALSKKYPNMVSFRHSRSDK